MFRVLYVDDEPEVLQIGRLFLEMDGQFHVDTITSAPAAFDLIGSRPYDAIISDYQMPVMDGIELLKKVRASGNTIPFILFTGRGREEIVIQALNEGADFYLQKGGDPKPQFIELSHKIRQAVQQRRAEIMLRDHERREAEILNFLPDATFAIDTSGSVITWNRAMEQMTGVAASDMLGKGNYEYALPIYNERRPILIDLVLKDDPVTASRYPYLKRDGKTLVSEITIPVLSGKKDVSLWFTASPLYDNKNAVIGAIESIRDITGRKQAEAALRESESRYRGVVEDQTEFICRFLPDGTHIFVNGAYCRYFNRQREEIIGKKCIPEIPLNERRRVREHFAALTRQNPTAIIEHRIIMPDGSVRWQRWSDRAIFSDDGILVEYQSVGRDITEIKAAGAALRESEAALSSIFRAAPVGIGVVSNRVFISVNDRLCEMTGFTREDLVGKSARMLYPDDAEFDFVGKEKYSQIRRYGTGSVETRWRFRDGSVHNILLSSTPLDPADPEGAVTFTALDITERKRAEEVLKESEEKYRALAENANDGIGIVQGTRIKYINPGLANLVGYKVEEICGKSILPFIPPESSLDLLSLMKRKLLGEPVPNMVRTRIIHRDGRRIEVEANGTIITWEGKKSLFGIIRDITEQKKAEQVLRESEEKYRTLADNLPDYILIHRNGVILYTNRACADITGLPSEALTGTPVLSFVAPESLALVSEYLSGPRAGEQSRIYEAAMIVKGGEKRCGVINSTPISYGGEPASLVVISDITDRKRAEDALRMANRQLTMMTAITRHDISNQIHVILMYLEMVKRKSRDPAMIELVQVLEPSSLAIRSQIEFTKLYQNIGSQQPQWLEPARLLASLQVPPPLTLTADLEGVKVFGDPMFEKVFFNLLDNSIRHGIRVTEIRVSSIRKDNGLTLVWEDNGVGIPADLKEKIFERGFGKNTGYGLFLAREMLSLTGITIRETGKPGRGARFEIDVPDGQFRVRSSG